MKPQVKITPTGKFSIKVSKVHYVDFIHCLDLMNRKVYRPKPLHFDAHFELELLADTVLFEPFKRYNKAVLLKKSNSILLTNAEARAFVLKARRLTQGYELLGVDLIVMELMRRL